MAKVTLETLAATLRARQKELMRRLASVREDVTAAHSADWSEQAQERQNDEVIQAIGNESRLELGKIHRALERIEQGEYCYCRNCGAEIPLERLAAVPYTDLCFQCASR